MNEEPDHLIDVDRSAKQTLLGDIKSRLMYLKAFLFLMAGIMCVVAIFVQIPTLTTAFLLAIGIWSFCRLYYFAFYVIEKYIDPAYKFPGLHSVIIYLIRDPGSRMR